MTPISEYLRRLATLQRLLRCPWYDIRVCVSPPNHRKEWYHAGQQVYYCAACQRLKEVA